MVRIVDRQIGKSVSGQGAKQLAAVVNATVIIEVKCQECTFAASKGDLVLLTVGVDVKPVTLLRQPGNSTAKSEYQRIFLRGFSDLE